MEIVSALLVASALTNLSFDISDIPEIRFESVTTEQAISEAANQKGLKLISMLPTSCIPPGPIAT
jgi:metal-dependent amidase/aminoacylase/carboxypeptidase family protein